MDVNLFNDLLKKLVKTKPRNRKKRIVFDIEEEMRKFTEGFAYKPKRIRKE